MKPPYDALILGAGGAGLFAAISAGKRGKRVLVIDHSPKPGGKILISGGGRCNFTNLGATAANYVSHNPHFPKSALAGFKPRDFVALVEKHKIPYHEKKLGQLFCDKSARDILKMLLDECAQAKAELKLGAEIGEVSHADGIFKVAVGDEIFEAPALMVATGGLSFPQLGASNFGYQLAKKFGHRVLPTSPALDGFVFGAKEQKDFEGLAGLSAEAVIRCGKKAFSENILVTHVGLSGPAALQASLYWEKGGELQVSLSGPLPKRLESRLASLKIDPADWRFTPERTVGFGKAEVTKGGVDTTQLSSKSMESSLQAGLYFIGEVVDVTGQLGGYNFQWAWASGFAAGMAI